MEEGVANRYPCGSGVSHMPPASPVFQAAQGHTQGHTQGFTQGHTQRLTQSGGRGIRTHDRFPYIGFQDRRHRPLGESSAGELTRYPSLHLFATYLPPIWRPSLAGA